MFASCDPTVVRTGVGLGEELLVRGVEIGEVSQVGQVHGGPQAVVEGEPALGEHGLDVAQQLAGLVGDLVGDGVAVGRVLRAEACR
jgi:hypothetical protein